MKPKNTYYAFLLCIICLSVYFLVFKIPYPGKDDLILKQPGINFFSGKGFSAPAITGLYPGVEKLFIEYPPVYPMLYGVWFFIFGFSLFSSMTLSLLLCYPPFAF